MSSIMKEDLQILYAYLHDQALGIACNSVSTMLAYYDFTLTFADEVSFVWKRPFTAVTGLFLVNRYATLLSRTLLIIQLLPYQHFTRLSGQQDRMICSATIRTSEILTVISQVSIAAFMAMRIYAIWDLKINILSIVFILGLVSPVASIYYYSMLSPTILALPFMGCIGTLLISESSIQKFNVAVRVSAMAADTAVLIFTWLKTWPVVNYANGLKNKPSLYHILSRDGTVYFAALLLLNVGNAFAINYKAFGTNAVPPFNDTVSSIIISRFLLNLRETTCSLATCYTLPSIDPCRSKSHRNSSILGNIGAPLYSVFDHPADNDQVEDDVPGDASGVNGSIDNSTSGSTTVELDETIVIYDGDVEAGNYYVVPLGND